LASGGWLNANAVVVAEAAEDESVPNVAGYELLDDRVYGDTRIAFLRLSLAPVT
jgi:16S rRNA G966 N2-methylase RsmD